MGRVLPTIIGRNRSRAGQSKVSC